MRYESTKTEKGNVGVSYDSQEAADLQAVAMDENGCRDCTDCDDCARCVRCANCARCTGYADCAGYFKGMPVTAVPVIEDIHKKVYEAASQPCALEMSAWHSDCGTAHCRAGWVVTLAGEEGAALEEATSTEFAAMAIYAASSDVKVSPTEFYLSNEEALEHMKELALL